MPVQTHKHKTCAHTNTLFDHCTKETCQSQPLKGLLSRTLCCPAVGACFDWQLGAEFSQERSSTPTGYWPKLTLTFKSIKDGPMDIVVLECMRELMLIILWYSRTHSSHNFNLIRPFLFNTTYYILWKGWWHLITHGAIEKTDTHTLTTHTNTKPDSENEGVTESQDAKESLLSGNGAKYLCHS